MTNRERILAALSYEPYDSLPILHFGFLAETLAKWKNEGHLTEDEYHQALSGDADVRLEHLTKKLGFDLAYHRVFSPSYGIVPGFETRVIETLPDGSQKIQTYNGVIVLRREGATGIPMEFDHILKGRKEWDELFRPRLQFFMDRLSGGWVN